MKLQVEQEDAIRVIAHYHDFNGDLQEWKNAFYELWRYQMTFDFAYKISVIDSRNDGVFIDMLIKPAYKKYLIDTMRGLGFGDVLTYDDTIGIVCDYEQDYHFSFAIVD